ncbi:MAG: hypothetical protein ACQES2_09305 [Pseudomonadota bacterium]
MNMIQTEALMITFFMVWLIEFYLFGMQRASLLIARNNKIDWKTVGPYLLPTWYPVTWLIRTTKWALIIALFVYAGWQIGLSFIVAGFVLSAIVPIPYKSLYAGTFRRSANRIEHQNPEAAELLRRMLTNSGFPT